ncbi:MAG TPA: AI-2E family transporter [Bacteriovoracaceae bacterium]|nr:AI-2E family transporter [Bacteriovoracaceae bacterium]
MEKIQIKKDVVIFFLASIIILLIGYFSRQLILITSIGLGIGVLITPWFRFLTDKYNVPRFLSTIIVVLAALLVFSLTFGSIIYLVADQAHSLQERWPEIQNNSAKVISSTFERFPWIQNQINEINFGSYLRTSAQNILQGFKLSVIVIGGAVFAIVLGFYTALNSEEYFKNLVEVFYPKHRSQAREILLKCAKAIRVWFRAQLIDMAIIGLLTGVGLKLAQVEYWAVFGLLTAVLGIIPYLGIIMVVSTTALITLSTDPSKVPLVMLIFFITQQLEGHVILPLAMKGGAELPVVPLLIFMMFLGAFFGVLGVFIAPALFAILRVLYKELYIAKIETRT